jgi:hypothetical protein
VEESEMMWSVKENTVSQQRMEIKRKTQLVSAESDPLAWY